MMATMQAQNDTMPRTPACFPPSHDVSLSSSLPPTTDSSPDRFMESPSFSLRVAIALNDMAVTMMERNCHGQGLDTLKDAVRIIKSMVPADPTSHRPQCPRSKTSNQYLHEANLRLSQPGRTVRSQAFSATTPALNVVSLLDGLHFVTTRPQHSKCRSFTMIRISDESYNIAGTKTDVQVKNQKFQATVLLYNLGVAQLLMSKNLSFVSSATALRHWKMASEVLKVCRRLLQPQWRSCHRERDVHRSMHVLGLTTLVLESLLVVLRVGRLRSKQDQKEEIEACGAMLSRVRHASRLLSAEALRYYDQSNLAAYQNRPAAAA